MHPYAIEPAQRIIGYTQNTSHSKIHMQKETPYEEMPPARVNWVTLNNALDHRAKGLLTLTLPLVH